MKHEMQVARGKKKCSRLLESGQFADDFPRERFFRSTFYCVPVHYHKSDKIRRFSFRDFRFFYIRFYDEMGCAR